MMHIFQECIYSTKFHLEYTNTFSAKKKNIFFHKKYFFVKKKIEK